MLYAALEPIWKMWKSEKVSEFAEEGTETSTSRSLSGQMFPGLRRRGPVCC
jgi:hypothetical protein